MQFQPVGHLARDGDDQLSGDAGGLYRHDRGDQVEQGGVTHSGQRLQYLGALHVGQDLLKDLVAVSQVSYDVGCHYTFFMQE